MKNNKYLKLAFISNGIFVFAASIIGPIFAIYINKFTADIATISFVTCVFLVSTASFLGVVTKFGSKIKNHSKYFIIGLLLRSIGWIGYLFATDIIHILLLQVFLGFAEAIGSTIFDVIVAEHINNGVIVEEIATWKLIQNLAAAIAALSGGFIAEFFGFNALFSTMIILSLVSAWVFHLGLREEEELGTAAPVPLS